MVEDATKNAVELGKNLYWVGHIDECSMFNSNPYLMIDDKEAVLFAPGPTSHTNSILEKITSLTDAKNIKYVIICQPDPDPYGLIPSLEKTNGSKFKIVTHTKNAIIMAHEGVQSEFYLIDHNNWKLELSSGREIKFLPAPFCSSPGAFMAYDENSKTLFPGDLFSGLSPDLDLFAGDRYKESMFAFHENYIVSHKILITALKPLSDLNIDMIAPQHGKIIKDDAVNYIEALRSLHCGIEYIDPFPKTDKGPASLRGEKKHTELVEAVVKREIKMLGKEKALNVSRSVSIEVDDSGNLKGKYGIGDLDRLLKAFKDEYGPIAIMYCRGVVQKLAKDQNLPLPEIIH